MPNLPYYWRRHDTTLILSSIIALSLIIKSVLFFLCFHGDPQQITQPDSASYLAPAQSLLVNRSFSSMFERTPGYPSFIAGIFWLFGQHLSAIIAAQLILSCLLILQVYFIGQRLFSKRAGLLSACLLAINSLLLSYNFMILSETLFVVLFGTSLLCGVYLFSGAKKSLLLTFLLGLFLALSTLTRPISYYLLFPIILGTAWYFFKNKKNQIILALFLLTLPSVVLIGGWKIRNAFLFHNNSYSNISTYNLYWHYAGTILQKTQHMTAAEAQHTLQESLEHQTHQDPGFLEQYMRKSAMHIISQHPNLLLEQILHGFPRLMLGSDPTWLVFFRLTDHKKALIQAKNDFLSANFNHLFDSENTTLVLVMLTTVITSLALTMYYIFFFIGLFQLKKIILPSTIFSHLFLLGCLCYFIAVSSNAISYGRFRVPFECIIDLYTSFGIVFLIQFIKRKKNTIVCEAH